MTSASNPPPPPLGTPVADRPRFRGVIHQYAAVVAAVGGVALVIGAYVVSSTAGFGETAQVGGAAAAAACAVYALTVVAVFAISASYHRIPWRSVRAQIWMKRADHSMIFLFIAGTYTPFCVLGLSAPLRWWVLGFVWAGALGGVGLKMVRPDAPRWLGVTLYIALGWVIVAVAPALAAGTGTLVLVLVALGGILYSVGGVFYGVRWPDLWPRTFGYHEVFHLCTAIAAVLHYAAVWLVLLR